MWGLLIEFFEKIIKYAILKFLHQIIFQHIALMIILKSMIIVLLLLSSHCKQSSSVIQIKPDIFPHTLFAHWHTDISQASTFTQFCINSMRKMAQRSNWNFILLNNDNLFDYMSAQSKEQFLFIRSHPQPLGQAAFADLMRIFVLRDNGGMWLDANSFFSQDLSWIENIQQQKNIENRISEEPQMIMFTSSQRCGGNRSIVFDERINNDVVLFPCLQIWSFITKPRSRLLNDLVDSIVAIYKKGNGTLFFKQNTQLGYLYMNEESYYFIYTNYHFQTLLQRKQREIEANRSAFKERYSIEYYNIWTFKSVQTAFRLLDKSLWTTPLILKNILYESVEDIKIQKEDEIYFFKFTSWYYRDIGKVIESLFTLTCLQVIDPVPEDSVINKFLLQTNEETEIVKELRELERRQKEGKQSNCVVFDVKNVAIYGGGFLGIIFILVCCLYFTYFWSKKLLKSVSYKSTRQSTK